MCSLHRALFSLMAISEHWRPLSRLTPTAFFTQGRQEKRCQHRPFSNGTQYTRAPRASRTQHGLIFYYTLRVLLQQYLRVVLGIVQTYMLVQAGKFGIAGTGAVRVARRDVRQPLTENKLRSALGALAEAAEDAVLIDLQHIARREPPPAAFCPAGRHYTAPDAR